MTRIVRAIAVTALSAILVPGVAQAQATVADYQRAEKFLAANTTPLVYHAIRPAWLADGRFWYRDNAEDGAQFLVVYTRPPSLPGRRG